MKAQSANPADGGGAYLSVLSLSVPVAMGYVPLGMIFGFLLVQVGAGWWVPPAMSVLVFAGAAQFMAVPLMAAGMSLGTIAVATAIINFRHVFYGLSLLQRMPPGRWARAYLVWALTDENYSVITTLPASTPAGKLVALAALNHFWWVLGSFIGAVAGAKIQLAWDGLDFSLAALFAVLAVEQWRVCRSALPFAVAALAYALALWIYPAQALLLALALSLLAAMALAPQQRVGR